MSASAPLPTNLCLIQTQNVVQQIKREIVSSPDIIDIAAVGPELPESLAPLYKKFGLVYLKYLQHALKGEYERVACVVAATIKRVELQESPMLAKTLFGRAECVSVSQVTITRLLQYNPIMVSLSSTQDWGKLQTHTLPEHNLVLLGVDRKKFMVASRLGTNAPLRTFSQVMKALKDTQGVIADTFLNCVCLISQYPQKAQPLVRYIESFGTRYVFGERAYSPAVKETFDRGFREAEEIHGIAVDLLKQNKVQETAKTVDRMEKTATFLHSTVKADVLDPMVSMLGQIFPRCVWKPKFDPAKVEWTVWTKGSSESDLHLVGQRLAALGYSVLANQVAQTDAEKRERKPKEYAVLLRDPFPERLHLQNALLNYPETVRDLIVSYAASY